MNGSSLLLLLLLSSDASNGLLLKALDGLSQTLHVVIIHVRDLLEPCHIALGRRWHELPARLAQHVDGVVVVVVADHVLGLVGSLSDDVLRHVYSCGVRVLGLDRVLPISPHSGDRVAEHQLLETPVSVDRR